jgi:phosphoglycolate phosphatase
LLAEIREVHQRHQTAEYAFLIEEVPSLCAAAGDQPVTTYYEEAISEFVRVRREVLRLYPGVIEFLSELRQAGVLIVAYTESLAYYTEYRFRKLGLDNLIDFLYSPADHDLPAGLSPETLRSYPASHYKMRATRHHHTPAGELKPNPTILSQILADVGATAADAVYVGDSLFKDIFMAQQAGVLDAHAAYGVAQHTAAYELLRAVTHWPDAMVSQEQVSLTTREITPTIVLEKSLASLSEHIEFVGFRAEAA